jgi:anti-anti-sigma factor
VVTNFSTTGSKAEMPIYYGKHFDGADISARGGRGRGVAEEPRSVAGDGSEVPVDLRALVPGTHLIALYRSDEEMTRTAEAFVIAGLEAGDRVLYVANDRPLPAFRAALRAGEAKVQAALAAGQLAVCRFSDVYGERDDANPEAVAHGFHTTVELARADGFPGLRIVAEMVGLARILGPIDKVLAWERLATRLHQQEGVTSVCQYDQQYLTRAHQRLLAAEHAGAAAPWSALPQATFRATSQGVRITGELDAHNRDECMRVVEARLATIPRLSVDVGGLTFIDVATLRCLYGIAAGLADGGHITLAHASPELHRMVELLGWRHPRLTIEPPVDNPSIGTEVNS